MLAKVISNGKNREQAIDTLKQSLQNTALYGVKTIETFLLLFFRVKPSDMKMLILLLETNDFSASGNKHMEFDEVAVLGAL